MMIRKRQNRIFSLLLSFILSFLLVAEGSLAVFAETEESSVSSESVEEVLLVSDAEGEAVSLEDVDEDSYDGFIYRLSDDVSRMEVRSMEKAIDQLPKDGYVEEIQNRELYAADSLETIAAVADTEMIKYIEPDYLVELSDYDINGNAETTDYAKQKEALELMNVQKVWNEGLFGQKFTNAGAENVVVALVDSLYSSDHPDLAGALLPGIDLSNGEAESGDDVGHGTTIAGVIAAQHNSIGVAGAMPRLKVLPVRLQFNRTQKEDGSYTYTTVLSNIEKGMVKAGESGADVINCSFAQKSTNENTSFTELCSSIAQKGTIIVGASGNDGQNIRKYPAGYDSVISVGAVDRTGALYAKSNYFDGIDVVAYGVSVRTTSKSGGYTSSTGTSLATPYVAALAAMAKSMDKSIDTDGFRTILQETSADRGDAGYDEMFGNGIADYYAVYEYIKKANDDKVSVTLDCDSYVYRGAENKPAVTVTLEDVELNPDEDYTVSYENNINAGTGRLVIESTGRTFDNVSREFEIKPLEIEAEWSNTDLTYTGKAQAPTVELSGVIEGDDCVAAVSATTPKSAIGRYSAEAVLNGEASGNYVISEAKRSTDFVIAPKPAAIRTPGRSKKYVSVKWKRQTAKMPKNRIAGYQAQLAQDAEFTEGVVTKSVSGYRRYYKKIGSLNRKTQYYVRVRTYYRTSAGNVYSNWSSVRAVKTK